MGVRVLHYRVTSAAGLYKADEHPEARRFHLTGDADPIEAHRVQEFAIVALAAGAYDGSAVDLDYQLVPGGAWASVQDSLVSGTRYTHITTNNVTYNQANSTFLPIHALRVDLNGANGWTQGTLDVYLILWLHD